MFRIFLAAVLLRTAHGFLRGNCIQNDCYGNSTCHDAPNDQHWCRCSGPWYGSHCEKSCTSHCLNGATCSVIALGQFECHCAQGFTGTRCEARDACHRDGAKCRHGHCEDVNGQASCRCERGWKGTNCDEKIVCPSACVHGDCVSNKCECHNGWSGEHCNEDLNECLNDTVCGLGNCTNKLGSYECSCPLGFTGSSCAIYNPPCHRRGFDLCHNAGVCDKQANKCVCPPQFTGARCDIPVDVCSEETCLNDGQCIPKDGDFECSCPFGFSGDRCETELDCRVTGCEGQGSCIRENEEFVCRCPPHRTGARCEFVDACDPNPCEHGSCVAGHNGTFTCQCDDNFSGSLCTERTSCSSSLCANGGLCVNTVDGARCQCPSGFGGANCERLCPLGKNGVNCDETTTVLPRVEHCEERSCLNGGRCVEEENGFSCDCDDGFFGRRCEKFNDYNATKSPECRNPSCQAKAGDGVCNEECNTFECRFDGGDCSAYTKPFAKCPQAAHCASVFGNGQCDQACNSEVCLFDGFDCVPQREECPAKDLCTKRFGDGTCDAACNNEQCAFDGGDCTAKRTNLAGSLVLVLDKSPAEFLHELSDILVTLSEFLRATVRIQHDDDGALAFEYTDGKRGSRIEMPKEQSLVGVFRPRRSLSSQQVLVFLEIDVGQCTANCFSQLGEVAEFVGLSAQALSRRGVSVHKVYEESKSESFGIWYGAAMGVMCMCLLMAIIAVVQQKRTRQRREIKAPLWIPPMQVSYTGNYPTYSAEPVAKNTCAIVQSAAIERTITSLHDQAYSQFTIQMPIDVSLVNAVGPQGSTPLIHLAQSQKMPELAEVDARRLVEAGANVNAQNEFEETALFIACSNGKYLLAKTLLELGADATIMDKGDSTCLHKAVATCRADIVRLLLAKEEVRRDINVIDNRNRTALSMAVIHNFDTSIVELLIAAGADVHSIGDKHSRFFDGRTALHHAALLNDTVMMRYLLDKGANKDAQDDLEATPLFLAARTGNVEAVHLLLEVKASKEICDQKSRVPAEVAFERGHSQLAALLKVGNNLGSRVCAPMPSNLVPATRFAKRKAPSTQTPPHSEGSTPSPAARVHRSHDSLAVSPYHVTPVLWSGDSFAYSSPPDKRYKHSMAYSSGYHSALDLNITDNSPMRTSYQQSYVNASRYSIDV